MANTNTTDDSSSSSSYPLAAQIPLQKFSLPPFPPEASYLRALTLTSDIKLDEYQTQIHDLEEASAHLPPSQIPKPIPPNLPSTLTSLTLELFHLGFPGTPPFLSALAQTLPNLKSLTIYSTLLDGLTPSSRTDAHVFLTTLLPHLQALHLIDSFARPGFITSLFPSPQNTTKATPPSISLKLLEISYTFRGHTDADFLTRLSGDELPLLLQPHMAAASFNLLPDSDPTDPSTNPTPTEKSPEGILPYATDSRASHALRARIERLSGGPLFTLAALNTSLYTLRAVEVEEVLYSCSGGPHGGVMGDLTISILMDDSWWDGVLTALSNASSLESLEVIGVPALAGKAAETGTGRDSEADAQALKKVCGKLVRFEISVLRAKSVGWVKWAFEGGSWRKE